MNIMKIIVGVILAGCVAFFLNTVLANKIEKGSYKIALKVTTYCVCFLLAFFFILFGSLRTVLDNFLDEEIKIVENKLNVIYPNVLETKIDTTELTSVLNDLNQAIETEVSAEYRFLKNVVFNAFWRKLSSYINVVKGSATKLASISDNEGKVTIKAILVISKKQALDVIYPYFITGQIVTIVLLLIYIGIYIGIIVFLRKDGVKYNNSIVFGEGAANIERGMDDRPI